MRALDGDHAKQFNCVHRRVGHLFQGRYKAILVDRDTYLIELSRYIHLNPVRAGIAMNAEDYRWSSARAYVGRRRVPPFLTVAEVLGHFGRTTRAAQRYYRQFLREAQDRRSAERPLDKVVAQTLLGDQEWVREMRCRIDALLSGGQLAFESSTEVPAVGQLRNRPTVEQVMDAVARRWESIGEPCATGTRAAERGRWRCI